MQMDVFLLKEKRAQSFAQTGEAGGDFNLTTGLHQNAIKSHFAETENVLIIEQNCLISI